MAVGLDLDEVPAGVDDHHLALFYGFTSIGNCRGLDHQRASIEPRDNQFPLVPCQRRPEVSGAWHRHGHTVRIVVKRELGTEYQGIRKSLGPATDVGRQDLGVEVDGFLEISHGKGKMENWSHKGMLCVGAWII